ncbi:MAG TPA: hypothetical protein VMW17_18895 [Candidatus Binatia bacterium]|nr:hypothetical protein [Candidatus Binatia bacterium]
MPNFRHRLPRSQQREYDRSNAVPSVPLRVSPRLVRATDLLAEALPQGHQPVVERLAQAVADEICAALRVPALRVHVRGTRPSNARGELHGLYSPGRKQDRIEVWMITAKRGQVVAFKTFVRTLLHEICHHLDYELLRLGISLHTDGFFKRESSLFAQIRRALPAGAARVSEITLETARVASPVG